MQRGQDEPVTDQSSNPEPPSSQSSRGRAEGRTYFVGRAIGRADEGPPVTSASLLASARRHAQRGLQSRDSGAHDDASLQLGTMLEHLAKAYLADLHPTLLVEDRLDFLSLVRLAGLGQRVGPAHSLKTVGLQGALERVGSLQAAGAEGPGKAFAKRFLVVTQARNGVAHVGDHGGRADEVAQLAVRGAHEILELMGRPLTDLFGDFTKAAEVLLNEHATTVQQLVALRLAQARASFAARFSTPDLDWLAALDAVTMSSSEPDDTQSPDFCPACNRLGVLSGTHDIDAAEDTVDDDGMFSKPAELNVVLIADAFRCPVCRFRLTSAEELAEAGLPRQVVLRRATDDDIFSILIEEGDERLTEEL
jgi:hypothetical protein